MNLKLDDQICKNYKSNSQIARVLTESWVQKNIYCTSCGSDRLNKFVDNSPVADFICVACSSEYELKSQKDTFSLKIVDGAYESMIRRINSEIIRTFSF